MMIFCTFGGHREVYHSETARKVYDIVQSILAIDDTFCFYTGGMGKFDEICSQVVRRCKAETRGKTIKLVLVEPYMKRGLNRNQRDLSSLYDDIFVPSELADVHVKRAILLRNRWMVEHADCMIAYVLRNYGGAYTMMSYAEKKGVPVFNVAPKS